MLHDLESLAAKLGTRSIGRSLELRESTESTMDDARDALANGAASGHVVLADAQSRGRGSHGRAWSSPRGVDLYLSIALRPVVPLERLATMTLAVGVGVARAVEVFVPADVTVKWPNDVLVSGAKCAGILVESRATASGVDGVVVGIGLNVNRREFDAVEGLEPTSIAIASGADVDRADVAARLLLEVERAIDAWSIDGLSAVLPSLLDRLAFRGDRIRIDGIEGTLRGVADDGCLVVATSRGLEAFSAGRIEHIG